MLSLQVCSSLSFVKRRRSFQWKMFIDKKYKHHTFVALSIVRVFLSLFKTSHNFNYFYWILFRYYGNDGMHVCVSSYAMDDDHLRNVRFSRISNVPATTHLRLNRLSSQAMRLLKLYQIVYIYRLKFCLVYAVFFQVVLIP